MTDYMPPPEEIQQALANYDAALAKQAKRIECALAVMHGPKLYSQEEMLAAANTLLTYGDGIAVQRAQQVLRTISMQIESGRSKPQSYELPKRKWMVEGALWAVISLGGFYILCGIAAVVIKSMI
jgi:hypothetical protein